MQDILCALVLEHDNIAPTIGAPYINTPGGSTNAVAFRAWSFAANYLGGIQSGTRQLQGFSADGTGWKKGETIDPEEVRLGIVGYGRIGRRMAEQAAFNNTGSICCHDIFDVSADRLRLQNSDTPVEQVDLDSLFESSNIISLHMPGESDEPPVITEDLLAKMQDGALLINTARGSVVDHAALLQHMDRIFYATDVYPEESDEMWTPDLQRIVDHPHFIGTQHSAANGVYTQAQLVKEGVGKVMEAATNGMWSRPAALNLSRETSSLNPRDTEGHRFVYTHKNVDGISAIITAVLAGHRINIEGSVNVGGETIAMTALDVNGVDSSLILTAHADILQDTRISTGRILVFN